VITNNTEAVLKLLNKRTIWNTH